MAYRDLREFIRALEQKNELKRITVEVDPILEITEFADRAVKQGGPALLFEKPKGYGIPVLINAFASMRKMEIALEVKSVEEIAAAHRGVSGDAHAGRPDRQAENAAEAGRDGRVLPEDRVQGRMPGSGADGRLLAARLPDPAMLAGRRRTVHHPAAGVFAQSRHRQAQLRHVPHAGVRRAHRGHALADAQAGRRALSPHAAPRPAAHGRSGGDRRRPGHHVLGDSAAAARSGRDDDRGLPARRVRWRW